MVTFVFFHTFMLSCEKEFYFKIEPTLACVLPNDQHSKHDE